MNLLLDTHVLLWWLNDQPGLSKEASDAIGNGRNCVFISAASVWEIRIKQQLDKLIIPDSFLDALKSDSFVQLDITSDHAYAAGGLPLYHRDPFDRMLIAQAQAERLTLVTRDPQIRRYGLPTIVA